MKFTTQIIECVADSQPAGVFRQRQMFAVMTFNKTEKWRLTLRFRSAFPSATDVGRHCRFSQTSSALKASAASFRASSSSRNTLPVMPIKQPRICPRECLTGAALRLAERTSSWRPNWRSEMAKQQQRQRQNSPACRVKSREPMNAQRAAPPEYQDSVITVVVPSISISALPLCQIEAAAQSPHADACGYAPSYRAAALRNRLTSVQEIGVGQSRSSAIQFQNRNGIGGLR